MPRLPIIEIGSKKIGHGHAAHAPVAKMPVPHRRFDGFRVVRSLGWPAGNATASRVRSAVAEILEPLDELLGAMRDGGGAIRDGGGVQQIRQQLEPRDGSPIGT